MRGRLLPLACLFFAIFTGRGAPQAPSWVGTNTFNWAPQLGGGLWYQEALILTNIAPALAEYPKPVLVGLRSDIAENGYRFDLNTFDSSAEPYNYWPDRASQEFVLSTLERIDNARFIWSMPTPDRYAPQPYGLPRTGSAYPWQKPEYYAAYLQYLIGPVTMTAAEYNALNPAYDFFADPSCAIANPVSELAVGRNWANLRARRGHPEPYSLEAVILGIEPYGDAQEAQSEGARYGAIAEKFRAAIRARGGPLEKIPLGLHVAAGGAVSDFERTWFKPMLDNVKRADFSYLDLYHHYRFGLPTNELNRVYPTLVHAGSANAASPGWQNWWSPRDTWASDFSRYLWIYEDTRAALKLYGENPARWKIGCSEHGLSITSRFSGNDMGAGIHWALWLAEVMRYNAQWDMSWVLAEQGYAHAQLQFRDQYLTRTPASFVYKMAQEFIGLDYCTNTFVSPTTATGALPEGGNYASPDVEVRVFKNSSNGNYHLFAVNKHATNAANIGGWESWTVANWTVLRANSFSAQNPIGKPWSRETIQTVTKLDHTAGQPLRLDPISVNHIELSPNQNALPVVFVETQQDGKENPRLPGLVRLTRTGPATHTLAVKYKLSGTATLTNDFTIANRSVVMIPSGSNYVDVEILPRTDTMVETPEYTSLILTPTTNYNIGAPRSACVYITD